MGAEQGVKIAQLTASAAIEHASGEAEGIRLMGQAKADAYQVGVNALGIESYTMLQAIQAIADGSVRVVPDVAVNGSGGGGGLLDGLMATFMRNETTTKNGDKAGNLPVLNGHKSQPVLVETVAELAATKVNSVSVKSPESLNHSPVAKSEALAEDDLDSLFGDFSDI